ncbi:MAG: Hpt domain-containing protein [Bdellovibrionales bacterium]
MSSDICMDAVEQIKDLMGDKFPGLVETYLRSNRVHVENLRKALEAGDAQSIVDAAHPMKSSAGNMGLVGLSHNAQELEQSAKDVVNGQGAVSDLEELIHLVEKQFNAGEAFFNSL